MKDVGRAGPVPVPRWLLLGAAVGLAVNVTMTFAGAWRTGVAWDETFHVFRMRNYLTHGWFITETDFVHGHPAAWVTNEYVYGPIAMMLLHGWSVLLGIEGPDQVSTTASAYAVRHVGIALVSVLGVLTVASTARLILGSWRWGLVSAALLTAMPLWSGHAMFNIKDLPVAVGYSCVTLGLVCMVGDRPTSGVRRRILGPTTLAAGVVLAMGTRPGIWPGVSASIAVLVLLEVLRAMSTGGLVPALWAQLPRLAGIGVGLLLAALVLGFAYPAAFSNPVRPLLAAAVSSSNYRGGVQGNRLYVPVMVLTQMPVLALLLFTLGVASIIWRLKQSRGRLDVSSVQLAVVSAQVFVLPVLAIARQSDLYNGLRQLLFAVPAAAIVAGAGLAWSLTLRRSPGCPTVVRAGVVCVVAGAILAPTVQQIRLFPYNYVAYNVMADLASVQVETDYWRTSVRELAPMIPRTGWVVCSPFVVNGRAQRFGFDGNEDCSSSPIGPLAPYDNLRAADPHRPLAATEFWAVIERTDRVPTNCSQLASVSRPEGFKDLTMSFVARCNLPFLELTTPVRSFSRPDSWGYLIGGWSIPHNPQGVRSTGLVAELGLQIQPALNSRRLVVGVTASRHGAIRLLLNGSPIGTGKLETGVQKIVVRIPAFAPESDSARSLRVQFRSMNSSPLGLTLRSLRLG